MKTSPKQSMRLITATMLSAVQQTRSGIKNIAKVALSFAATIAVALSSLFLSAEQEKGLAVYFLNVGQAHSALVVADGATMLIDGGNPQDSQLVYTFLKNKGITHLDYMVATHAHADHVGGL